MTPQEVQVIAVTSIDPYVGAWQEKRNPADEIYFVTIDGELIGKSKEEAKQTAIVLTGTADQLRDFAGKLGLVVAETERERLTERVRDGRKHLKDVSTDMTRGLVL